jgi:ATP-dependent Clp protease protease subunit
MNSVGGNLDDGIALFGFLRSLPIKLTTINVGLIASIAIAPFLAGSRRIALSHSHFHFHDFEYNYAAAHNLTRLEYQDHTQILSSARDVVFELLKENTSLTDSDLKELKLLEVPTIKDAAFAKAKGIVHEVDYFPFPEQMNILNVDY